MITPSFAPMSLRADRALRDEITSVTNKLTIGAHNVYAHLGWFEGHPVYVDVVVAHDPLTEIRRYQTPEATELATQIVDNARASIEVICRQASRLLASRTWTLDDLIASWSATKFDPCGVCPQVERIVKSPLDAVAALCALRKAQWEQEFGSVQ